MSFRWRGVGSREEAGERREQVLKLGFGGVTSFRPFFHSKKQSLSTDFVNEGDTRGVTG